jgi:hypothetical protein
MSEYKTSSGPMRCICGSILACDSPCPGALNKIRTLTAERDALWAKVDSQRVLVDFVPGEMLAAAERRIAELEKGPLSGYQHPWGTCDWGECDEPATEWRWSESDLMHLPVCDRHSAQSEVDTLRAALRRLSEANFAMSRRFVHCLECAARWPSHRSGCRWDAALIETERALLGAQEGEK